MSYSAKRTARIFANQYSTKLDDKEQGTLQRAVEKLLVEAYDAGGLEGDQLPVMRIRSQYIGVLTLLGAIGPTRGMMQDQLDRAIKDGNAMLKSLGSEMTFADVGGGKYGPFMLEQLNGK